MKVIGITEAQISAITGGLGLELDNFRSINTHSHAFRVVPVASRGKYSRTTAHGRHMRITCYHGFRDVIRRYFEAGATSIKTASFRKTLHTEADFDDMLPKLADQNVGSLYRPVRFIDLCDCGGEDATVPS